MRDPLLLPALALIGGITAAETAGFTATEALVLVVLTGLLAILARVKALRTAAAASGLTTCAATGALVLALHPLPEQPKLNVEMGERVRLAGCVVEPAVLAGDRVRFVLEIDTEARVRVNGSRKSFPALPVYGERMNGVATIREPLEFRNPGAFSYRHWLARRAIFWTASVRETDNWQSLDGRCGAWAAGLVHRARTKLLRQIDAIYGADRYHGAMMRGLLLGDSSAIQKSWVEAFRRTGTYHALVISGGHVAFLTGLFLLWLRIANAGRAWVLCIAALVAWSYALLAGGDAPVLRSAAGFTLYAVACLVYRRTRLLNLLALVAIMFLLADPRQLFEASFQLSFLAVAAIGALAEPLARNRLGLWQYVSRAVTRNTSRAKVPPQASSILVEIGLLLETVSLYIGIPSSRLRWPLRVVLQICGWVTVTLLVSACVQVALALPMILYFHRLSWTGLTANLIVTPMVTLAIPLGLAAIAAGGGWLASGAAMLLDAAALVAGMHAEWELPFRVADPPLWLSVLLTASLIATGWGISRSRRWGGAAFLTVLSLIALAAWYPLAPAVDSGRLELTALDVGNGDSLFLGLPGGGAVVVDSGGMPVLPGSTGGLDTGEDVVSPYLWWRRVTRLEALVMSHSDLDHSGGMLALLENFCPREFWLGKGTEDDRTKALLARARALGVRVVRLEAGQALERGGVRWEVLNPRTGANISENDGSLVLRVVHGRQSFLLAGDLESRGEERLLRGGLGRVGVLKVSHHGSRTGTGVRFLDEVRPVVALIPAGRGNRFGFPHRQVLDRLSSRGTFILRTDVSGATGVITDGKTLGPSSRTWAVTKQSPWPSME